MIIDIKETLETSFSIRGEKSEGGKDLVNHTATKSYRAVVKKGADESIRFSEVTEADIACDYRLPIVNKTTWHSDRSKYSMPFAVCRSKDVVRSPTAGNVFNIVCNFDTGPIETEQCLQEAPKNPSDIKPQVSFEVGSYERVIFQDKDGNPCWRLPGTNTPFQNPITETIPTMTLVQTQFEEKLEFQDLLDRSFKVNENEYRGKPAGSWMIGAVRITDQDVTLSNGSIVTWSKVTYPIILSERYYYEPCADATDPVNKIFIGHKQSQPLVDGFKVKDATSGKVVPMIDTNSGNVTTGYIYKDDSPPSYVKGMERTAAPGGDCDRPDYLLFRTQDSIDFDSFLRDENE